MLLSCSKSKKVFGKSDDYSIETKRVPHIGLAVQMLSVIFLALHTAKEMIGMQSDTQAR